jgi:hypothetical protein
MMKARVQLVKATWRNPSADVRLTPVSACGANCDVKLRTAAFMASGSEHARHPAHLMAESDRSACAGELVACTSHAVSLTASVRETIATLSSSNTVWRAGEAYVHHYGPGPLGAESEQKEGRNELRCSWLW